MADLHDVLRGLEKKVVHYEAVMSKCPQCKTTLQTSEADSTTQSSPNSRASRSAQQPNTKVPPPALTAPSKRPAPAFTLSSSARSSKKPPPTSRAEPQASDMQQGSSLTTPAAASNRSHRNTEVPILTLRPSSINSSNHPTTGSANSLTADSSEKVTTSSQTLSTRTSSAPLWTADVRHSHSGQLVDLDLVQYKSRNRGGRPPGESPKYDWKRTAEILLEEVPFGQDWREKVTSMDSSIIAAVAMDIAPVSEGYLSPTEDVERKELIRLVRKYAERHSEGRLNFQHYILVCLCKVLSSQGVPKEIIVETLQICVSDTGRRNIDRYLKAATWSNKLMDELFHTDWGYRAVDLIAIWNRPVATYGRMSDGRDSRQYLITSLTQRKYFEGYEEVPDRKHDTIPWIVKKELRDEVSYRDICGALGYSDEYILQTRNLHSSQPSSPNMDSGPVADGGVAHGKRSFHTVGGLASHASSHQRQISVDMSPKRTLASGFDPRETSMDAGSTSSSDSFHSARQSTIGASSPEQPTVVAETPSHPIGNDSYLQELRELPKLPLTRRQTVQKNIPGDAAGRALPTSPSVASQGTKRIVPDRSAEPSGDPDVVRRRRKPEDSSIVTELSVSTSLGESAPDTQGTKRPLPRSPTTAAQPTDTARRHHQARERSGREGMGRASQLEKKDSKNQRGRA